MRKRAAPPAAPPHVRTPDRRHLLHVGSLAGTVAHCLRHARWRLVAVRSRQRLMQVSARMGLVGGGVTDVADMAMDMAHTVPLPAHVAATLAADN